MTAREPEASIATPAADEAVWRLANALAGSVTPLDVADAVALEGGRAGGGLFANMAVFEPGSGQIVVFRRVGENTGWRAQLAEEPSCDAIRNGLPVMLGSLKEIARRYPGVLELVRSAGLQAGSAWPLFAADGAALGAIGFGWATPQEFGALQRRRLDLIAHLTGLALDRTTKRKSWQDGIAQVLDEMPNGFCVVDADFRVSSANVQAARLLGVERQELVGVSLFDIFPDSPAGNFGHNFRRAMKTLRTVEFEEYCSSRDSWFEVRASPATGGLNVYFSNIDERHASELNGWLRWMKPTGRTPG